MRTLLLCFVLLFGLVTPLLAQEPEDTIPYDFGFVPGEGYPPKYQASLYVALQHAAKVGHVLVFEVVQRWNETGRQQSVFEVLETLADERAMDYAAAKCRAGAFRDMEPAGPMAPPTPSGVSPGVASGVIESRVDGEFNGFDGETVIRLANGQIWKQVEYWYHYHYAYSPQVLIYRDGAYYRMKVEGIDRAVEVERLK
jgi:hypothetical protein